MTHVLKQPQSAKTAKATVNRAVGGGRRGDGGVANGWGRGRVECSPTGDEYLDASRWQWQHDYQNTRTEAGAGHYGSGDQSAAIAVGRGGKFITSVDIAHHGMIALDPVAWGEPAKFRHLYGAVSGGGQDHGSELAGQ